MAAAAAHLAGRQVHYPGVVGSFATNGRTAFSNILIGFALMS